MSVVREHHTDFERHGVISATALHRAAAGGWTVELSIDLRLVLPDGREVRVRRESLSLLASEQIGRRPRKNGNGLHHAAQVAGMWPMSGPRK